METRAQVKGTDEPYIFEKTVSLLLSLVRIINKFEFELRVDKQFNDPNLLANGIK